MQLTLQTVVHLLAWLAALVTMGAWTVAGFLRPRTGENRMRLAGDPLLRVAGVGALVGAALSAWMATLTSHGSSTAWVVSAVCLLGVAALTLFTHFESAIYALALSALALVAPIAATEQIAARNLDWATDAQMVAVVAFTVLGGTWLCSLRASDEKLSEPTIRWRLRFLTTVAALLVAFCDLVTIACRLGFDGWDSNASWHAGCAACAALITAVVWLLPGRTAALVASVLGVVGQVCAVQSHQVLSAAAAEQVPTDVRSLGYSVAAGPTLHNLSLQWRVNLFFLALALVAVGTYLFFVAQLRRRGDHWPAGRTAAWLIGWAIVVFVTCSGVGRYAPAVFSVHMFMNLALNMLGAMILVLGGFITLLLRATPAHGRNGTPGLREWVTATMHSRYLGFLYNPIIALVFMTGTYYVFYLTGLYTASLHTHWLHQFFYLHFLVSGYIFYGLIIGVDQPPHPLPHIGKLGLIIGAMPFHAFFGVILMSKGTIFAEDFLNSLGHPWISGRGLLHDQWVGGSIAWAGGEFPLVIALIALLTQWSRQDRKEGRRIDRHLDAGTDESYDAYNDMLAQLAERDRAGGRS